MTQLPEDFLSLKSFKSLTNAAGITWMLLLIIDVIFISGMEDEYRKLKWIWIIGLVIAFVMATLRLYAQEEKERQKGDKIFLLFNAALIFLYASGFNGFTKELGGWTLLQKNLEKKEAREDQVTENTGSIFGVLLAWTPSIFVNQTAVWPDVQTIAENNKLYEENIVLRDSLQITKITLPFDSAQLLVDNVKLQEEIVRLQSEIQILLLNQSNEPDGKLDSLMRQNQNLLTEIKRLRSENTGLKSDNKKLQEQIRILMEDKKCEAISNENAQLNKQVQTLLARINSFNDRQQNWEKANQKVLKAIKEQVNSAVQDKSFYDFLFLTPIETKL